MAPQLVSTHSLDRRMTKVTKPTDPAALIAEAWAQGFMVGAIIIMICITISNLRRGVILHKLILLELILGSFHGTFIFTSAPIYGWYLSITAIFLILSWNLHNVIAWIKTRPFIGRKTSLFYIGTVLLVQPYWILEIYADFAYFNNINDIYLKCRVFEALFRDPWWVYTTCCLLYNIHTRYNFTLMELMRISPRFAIMLTAMILSIIFIIVDICAVTSVLSASLPIGINPFWKLAFVFKLLTDSVILDDFKTALDKLSHRNMSRVEEQWGGDWAQLNKIVSDPEKNAMPVRLPSEATICPRTKPIVSDPDRIGIAVTKETKVETCSLEEVEVVSPPRCLQK